MAIKDHRLFMLEIYDTNVPSGLIFKDDEGNDPKLTYTQGEYTTFLFARPVVYITDESLSYTRAIVLTYGNSRASLPFVDGKATIPLLSTGYIFSVQ